MLRNLVHDNVSVVLLGKFNPAIFTPAWFALNGLLPERVASSAEVNLIHGQVADFTAEWLQVRVRTDRFMAETHQVPHLRVAELVVGIFKDNLAHTPCSALGINREVHFYVADTKARDRMGRMLAPVEPWGDWRKDLGNDGHAGGMTSVTMTQVNIEGRRGGDQINVTVAPSMVIGESGPGVYVRVNDHFTIDQSDGQPTAPRLMSLLEKNFDLSLRRSTNFINHVESLGKA